MLGGPSATLLQLKLGLQNLRFTGHVILDSLFE